MIVGVNYKNEKTGKYGGRAYSYYCEVEGIKVGDLMVAPVKDGERTVQIVELDVDPTKLEGIQLKTITKRWDPEHNNGKAEHNNGKAEQNNGKAEQNGAIEEKSIIDIELPEPDHQEALSIENVILLKQLPIIEDRVKELGEKVSQRVETATSLVCTEDTYKEIKKERADLNKEFAAMEEQRKAVKKAILAPYDRFEATYKEHVAKPYQDADKQLGAKIREVEDSLKDQKFTDVLTYFNEYRTSKGLGWLDFGRSGIQIRLTDSVKKLKEQARAFIDRIDKDMEAITSSVFHEEVMAEYLKDLDLAAAIARVEKSVEQAKAAAAAAEARAARTKAQQEVAAKVQREAEIAAETQHENVACEATLEAPTVKPSMVNAEKEYRCSFCVTGSLDKLKALKRFLEEGGYNYEQL